MLLGRIHKSGTILHPEYTQKMIDVNIMAQDTHSSSALHMAKCSEFGNQNHFNAVLKLMWHQQRDWWGGKTIHNIGQEADCHVVGSKEQDRSIDAVRVKYINLDTIMSIIFTKLESSKRQTHKVYKVDTGADGNLMPL